MPKRTSRPFQRLKARVIRRDDGICHLCGQAGANTADHLVPYSLGGADTMDNLAAAHIDCNRRRGARPTEVARAELTPKGWRW